VFNYSLSLAPAQFRKEVHLRVRSIRDRQMHDVRLAAWVLLGAVLAVLLIACANVTSLLMARAAQRETRTGGAFRSGREPRPAGAAKADGDVSFVDGGSCGGTCSCGDSLRVFIAIAPAGIPFLEKAHLDLRIVVFRRCFR
jgi:putative ABC transport system permease protein